jgi:hypothetical protein
MPPETAAPDALHASAQLKLEQMRQQSHRRHARCCSKRVEIVGLPLLHQLHERIARSAYPTVT